MTTPGGSNFNPAQPKKTPTAKVSTPNTEAAKPKKAAKTPAKGAAPEQPPVRPEVNKDPALISGTAAKGAKALAQAQINTTGPLLSRQQLATILDQVTGHQNPASLLQSPRVAATLTQAAKTYGGQTTFDPDDHDSLGFEGISPEDEALLAKVFGFGTPAL